MWHSIVNFLGHMETIWPLKIFKSTTHRISSYLLLFYVLLWKALIFVVDLSIITIYTLAQLPCDRCSSALAVFWCKDCDVDYCTPCCTDVHKGRTFSQHRRVPIEEKTPEPKRCDLHRDERIKYLCSCGLLICRDCQMSEEHEGHKPKPILNVIEIITKKVSI